MPIKPLSAFLLLCSGFACGQGPAGLAQATEQSRIRGGLCVWVGNADAATAAQWVKDRPFLVEMLTPSDRQTEAARSWLVQNQLHGQITAQTWTGGSLPYADNLVSLLLVEGGAAPDGAECQRVLRPLGELLDCRGGKVVRTVKPRPAEMDDWTHWRHGPDRNPVSRDAVVTVPERIQWLLPSPVMSERSHLVTANGRIFSQDREVLTARDACNGLPLWRVKLKKGREFDWEWTVKVSALVVAVGERVYALLEDGSYAALDAATGRVVHVFAQAGNPYDALVAEDGKSKLGTLVTTAPDAVRAFDAESGRLLWQQSAVQPGVLIAGGQSVFYIEGNDKKGAPEGVIFARDLTTGSLLWSQRHDWARRTEQGAFGHDRLVFEMRNPVDWRQRYEADPKAREEDRFALAVISAKTGELIQKVRGTGTSARHGEFRAAFWHSGGLVTEAIIKNQIHVVQFGLDDFTKPARTFRASDVGDRGFGHCYPPVLTERYYLNGQMNLVDMATGSPLSNPITRGGCNTARSGYIPANGLIYTFPKHCICYPMLDGNVALAPKSPASPPAAAPSPLVKGPAWPAQPGPDTNDEDWPTFRHDAWRTGGTTAEVSDQLAPAWTVELGAGQKSPFSEEWSANPCTQGPLTPPVVAEKCVLVAQGDSHRLVALDLESGRLKWEFVAGGRIDTPPTVHRGMCLVGCRDGWVYNLRMRDGALIWKRSIAPWDRRIMIHAQLESPWGVAGSILVSDGLAVAVAGLHPNSDGGIRVVAFDPATGEPRWEGKFDDLGFSTPWPAPYDPRVTRPDSDPWRTIRPLEYPPLNLPVRDGDGVAVSRCVFDFQSGGKELKKTKGFYFVKPSGAWLPRSAWRYGTEREGSPQAVSLGASVFGTAPAASKLFRVDFKPGAAFNDDWVHAEDPKQEVAKEAFAINKIHALGPVWESPSQDNRRMFNRAMLVAGSRLFTVTPRGNLTVHATADGKQLAELKLDMPVWNGLAAVRGALLVTTQSGKVICLRAKP